MNFFKIITSLIKGKDHLESASTVCRLASGFVGALDPNPTGKDDFAATVLESTADILDALRASDSNKVGAALDAAIVGLQTARAGLTANGICN
jgi:hypothetical protein